MKTKKVNYETLTVVLTPQIAARIRALATLGGITAEAVASAMVNSASQANDWDSEIQMHCIEEAREIIAEIPRLVRPLPRITPAILAMLDLAESDTLMDGQTILEDNSESLEQYTKKGSDFGYFMESLAVWYADGLYSADAKTKVGALIADHYRDEDLSSPGHLSRVRKAVATALKAERQTERLAA